MRRIRLGCVKYLNTLPLVEGLQAWRDADLVNAVPAKLIGLLMGGEVDLALASVVDVAMAPEPVVLLPAGMIGCDGPTLTVRLYSKVPLDQVTRVHADTDSHTSVVLVRVLLAARKGGDAPEVVDYDARERVEVRGGASLGNEGEWPEALLLIGDKVVTDAPPAERYPHQMDLGEAWKALTGLPFVYAVWMCRAADWDGGGEAAARIRAAAEVLDRGRRRNAMRTDWLVGARAGDRGWPEDLARRYVGELLRYEVGGREREAVERFLGMAADLGLAKGRGVSGVRWAEV